MSMPAKRVDPMREEKRVAIKLIRYVSSDEKIGIFSKIPSKPVSFKLISLAHFLFKLGFFID